MKFIYGGYGHNPRGKQYTYIGSNNLRTGQRVVAPITNKWNRRTYNTMFTIMRTSGGDAPMGTREAQRLSQKGIGLKIIQGTDTLGVLPGGQNYKSKAEWARASQAKYQTQLKERLMGAPTGADTSQARQRLLGE